MERKTYDFLVIGTIKAATTTLHYLLADHPEVSLPREKEAPLFLRDVSDEEVAAHVRQMTGSKPAKLAGKVTPLYMCRPDVAGRIYKSSSQTKLIALLRDPVERARSHWRMCCQQGRDSRTFAEVVADQLSDTQKLRSSDVEEDGYVAYGEYGRVINEYLDYFPKNQLLVLGSAELQRDPVSTLAKVCGFLGLEPHVPRELGRDYNVSQRAGERSALDQLLWKIVPYDWALKITTPKMQRRAAEVLDRFGIARPKVELDESLPEELLLKLQDHYVVDARSMPIGLETEVNVWPWAHN